MERGRDVTRLVARLARLEARRTGEMAARGGVIVIYDAATGDPLPGYIPPSNGRVSIWIPANGREYNDDVCVQEGGEDALTDTP